LVLPDGTTRRLLAGEVTFEDSYGTVPEGELLCKHA